MTSTCFAAETEDIESSAHEVHLLQNTEEDAAQSATSHIKLAVVPYFNASDETRGFETRGYVGKTVDAGYTNYFSELGYQVVPAEETQAALDKTGYTTDDEELPEKEQLAAVANATGADYVVAMMIDEIHATEHASVFQLKITAKTRLAYQVYAPKTDELYSFKATSHSDNKTVFGGVGPKTPIVKTLKSAMEKANDKIQTFISKRSNVEITQ